MQFLLLISDAGRTTTYSTNIRLRILVSAYDLATTCALLGKKEEALQYLQAAYEKRETGLLYLNRNPDFNILHDDLIYKEITERVAERLSKNPQL